VPLQLDHVFICVAPDAPEADALLRLGLREGSSNVHPGQGTANRRFFFCNAYLELLWVSNEREARAQKSAPTRLWQRWSERASGACPIALIFRPGAAGAVAPFETWSYQPDYLPPGLSIEFAQGMPIDEPEIAYLPFALRTGARASEPTAHDVEIHDINAVVIGIPGAATLSAAARAAQAEGLVTFRASAEHVVELQFFTEHETSFDLRPTLPLIFRGVPPPPGVEK
jgi:hypothetical protein